MMLLAAGAVIAPVVATQGTSFAAGATLPGGLVVSGVVPAATQFDVTGFIQNASVDVPGDPHSGGKVTVNGQTIVVPRELIAILPASALTWEELFALAPAPYGPTQSGLAMADLPTPGSTYEINVVGNRVTGKACGALAAGDCYIAGLVHITQQDLNAGAGYINFIDYDVGPNHDAELRVGGVINDNNCKAAVAPAVNVVAGGTLCSGARVRIMDPANAGSGNGGRYGRAFSPDVRFTVDQDNPTIATATGFPMCIPRTLKNPTDTLIPATGVSTNDTDPLCPLTNRLYKTTSVVGAPFVGAPNMLDTTAPGGFAITTNTGTGLAVIPGYVQNANLQIPMEVGDYVNYAGTVLNDSATPTARVAGATTYIAAHTIINNFAAFTAPDTNPAYVSIEVSIVGTGGLTVFGAGEAAVRSRFEGMTTDPTRNVHVYANDLNPSNGAVSERDWGLVTPDPGPPGGAVEGRWRVRPPCAAAPGGAVTNKVCSQPPGGAYVPPSREMRAVIDGGLGSVDSANTRPNPQTPGFVAPIVAAGLPGASPTSANGIVYGQYHAPIAEYLFPENIPGNPIVANNFEAIPFLAYGGYSSATGTVVGQLNPWPGAIAPAQPVCVTAGTGGPYSVSSAGGAVNLTGTLSVGATTPVVLSWTSSAGTLTNATSTTPTLTVPPLVAGTVINVGFSATNLCGTSTATTTVTVVAAASAPTVVAGANQNAVGGAKVTLSATGTSTGANPAGTVNLQFTQTAGATVTLPNGGLVLGVTSGAAGTLDFTAPNVATILTFAVTATDVNGTSAQATTNVSVSPTIPLNIVVTTAQYRISKARLDFTVTYTGPGANTAATVLKLMPYVTTSGTTYDPAVQSAVFTAAGGNVYNLTLIGSPTPACNPGGAFATPCSANPIVVEAFDATTNAVQGTSVATKLTNIRQ
jgi:hypothetical protein